MATKTATTPKIAPKVAPKVGPKLVSVGKSNLLAEVAAEVESLTQAKAFALVPELVSTVGLTDFRLAGVLARIQTGASNPDGGAEWLDGHKSFQDLIENNFGLHYRKAMYLIDIYKNLVDKEIPWESVKDVGWTKLAIIAKIITAKNVETWVARSKKNTAMQLADLVRSAQTRGSSSEKETSALTTLTFKLHADQKAGVKDALEKAKNETGTKNDTVALHNIAQAYLGNAVEMVLAGSSPDDAEVPAAKPKTKGKLIAYFTAKAKAVFAEIGADTTLNSDEKYSAALDSFDEIFPEIQLRVEPKEEAQEQQAA